MFDRTDPGNKKRHLLWLTGLSLKNASSPGPLDKGDHGKRAPGYPAIRAAIHIVVLN